MGDTERPRYTGFRGLSVRGITALQCSSVQKIKNAAYKKHSGTKLDLFQPMVLKLSFSCLLSTPIGEDYVVIGFDMEVQPLVTHNAA